MSPDWVAFLYICLAANNPCLADKAVERLRFTEIYASSEACWADVGHRVREMPRLDGLYITMTCEERIK